MPVPKCPKCPYGNDGGIVPSTVKVGQWYCTLCGSYFPRIGDVSPIVTVKTLTKLETDDYLRWLAEEVDIATDRALAKFYAGINSEDRADLKRWHIDINGDFRPEVKRESNPQNSGSAPSSWRDNL